MRSACFASGISMSSNFRPRAKRLAYSAKPSLIQSGRRVPAAISRTRTAGSGVARAALRGAQVPELLETVELPDPGQHDVHDQVLKVDQDPFPLPFALDAVGAVARLAATLDDAVGNRLDVPVRGAGGDDHRVGDVGQLAHVE